LTECTWAYCLYYQK